MRNSGRLKERLSAKGSDEGGPEVLGDCTNKGALAGKQDGGRKKPLPNRTGDKGSVKKSELRPKSLKSEKPSEEEQTKVYARKRRKSEGDVLVGREVNVTTPRSLQPARAISKVGTSNKAAFGDKESEGVDIGLKSWRRRRTIETDKETGLDVFENQEGGTRIAASTKAEELLSRPDKSSKRLNVKLLASLDIPSTSSPAASHGSLRGQEQRAAAATPSGSTSHTAHDDTPRSGGSSAKKVDSQVHTLFVEKQRALFADVDAFELEEDESESSQEVEAATQTDES